MALGLAVLAIARSAFTWLFLHITTGPDNTNNALALAFGMLMLLLAPVSKTPLLPLKPPGGLDVSKSSRGREKRDGSISKSALAHDRCRDGEDF